MVLVSGIQNNITLLLNKTRSGQEKEGQKQQLEGLFPGNISVPCADLNDKDDLLTGAEGHNLN